MSAQLLLPCAGAQLPSTARRTLRSHNLRPLRHCSQPLRVKTTATVEPQVRWRIHVSSGSLPAYLAYHNIGLVVSLATVANIAQGGQPALLCQVPSDFNLVQVVSIPEDAPDIPENLQDSRILTLDLTGAVHR